MQGQNSTPLHGAILSLLFLTLAASLGVVGLLFLLNKTQPSNEQIVSLCANQASASAATAAQMIANACNDEGELVVVEQFVPAINRRPGFAYPSTWSVLSQDFILDKKFGNIVYLNENFIHFCTECDGGQTPIMIRTSQFDLAKDIPSQTFKSFEEMLNYEFSQPWYSEIKITKEALDNGTLYIVSGHIDGLYSGDFESYIYQGPSVWQSRATFTDTDPDNRITNDAWEIVKRSLDFSLIQ